MLAEHTDLEVIGDKAYINADKVAELRVLNRVHLETLPRRHQNPQQPRHIRRLFNAVRQIVEAVNGQLTEQMNIETNCAFILGTMCSSIYQAHRPHHLYLHQPAFGQT